MAYDTAARGRLIAGCYRCAASRLGEDHLTPAIAGDGGLAGATVRLAVLPATIAADAVADWEAAWRSLAEHGLVPDLIEIAHDDDLGAVAVLGPAAAAPVSPGDPTAILQVDRLGAALAAAGIDLEGLRIEELGLDEDGRLRLDGIRWSAERPLAPAAGALLVRALVAAPTQTTAFPPPFPPAWAVPDTAPEPSPQRPRPSRTSHGGHGLRRRLLWAVIGGALIATTAILILPRSATAPATLAPELHATAVEADLLLATAAPADPPRKKRRKPTAAPAPTVRVVSAAAPVATSPPPPDPAALPVVGGAGAGGLPLAGGEVAALAPLDGDGHAGATVGDGNGEGWGDEEAWDDPEPSAVVGAQEFAE